METKSKGEHYGTPVRTPVQTRKSPSRENSYGLALSIGETLPLNFRELRSHRNAIQNGTTEGDEGESWYPRWATRDSFQGFLRASGKVAVNIAVGRIDGL